MTEFTTKRAALLDSLACDLGARPAGAPALTDLAVGVLAVRRTADVLEIEFAAAARDAVAAAVAAERMCCPAIGWELTQEPVVRLRISATPAQLDILAVLFGG